MTTPAAPLQIHDWHRQVAMQCNNRAWELSARARTPHDDREMLDAAHASAWHWAQVGTELNRMRATMLLAAVHAEAGHGTMALRFAEEMAHYFFGKSDTPDWEVAFTHAVYAHACAVARQHDAHRAAYARAVAATAAVADVEDRQIVELTLRRVPTPA